MDEATDTLGDRLRNLTATNTKPRDFDLNQARSARIMKKLTVHRQRRSSRLYEHSVEIPLHRAVCQKH